MCMFSHQTDLYLPSREATSLLFQFKAGTHEGTSPYDSVPATWQATGSLILRSSHFATKGGRSDKTLVPAPGPANSNRFEFMTCSSKRFV